MDLFEKIIEGATAQIGKYDDAAEKNLDQTLEYVKERTYKLSDLYISLNVGILTIGSVVFISQDLAVFSRWCTVFLLSSIGAIIEMLNRRKFLQILEEDAQERMKNTDECNQKVASYVAQGVLIPKDSPPERYAELSKQIATVTPYFNNRNQEIHRSTDGKIKPILNRRRFAEVLILISLTALFAITLSELGIIDSITEILVWL